jgi:hypothetical protein
MKKYLLLILLLFVPSVCLAGAYTWTTFPASGTSNFESTARAALEAWRTNAASMDTEIYNARKGLSDLEASIDAKAAIDHTHGAGGVVVSIVANEGSLGTGSTDGEIAITADNQQVFVWDDGGSAWINYRDGYATIYIPASSMKLLETNGAEAGSNEYATNDIMEEYLAFDGSTEEYVSKSFPMSERWDLGTIKLKYYWSPGDSACSAGDTVEWECAAGALSDDDAIDATLGTSQVISDTVLTGKDGDLHITSATPALTVGGTPASGDLIHFKFSRNVSGTDDMAEDAWLFGARIQFALTEVPSAW